MINKLLKKANPYVLYGFILYLVGLFIIKSDFIIIPLILILLGIISIDIGFKE